MLWLKLCELLGLTECFLAIPMEAQMVVDRLADAGTAADAQRLGHPIQSPFKFGLQPDSDHHRDL